MLVGKQGLYKRTPITALSFSTPVGRSRKAPEYKNFSLFFLGTFLLRPRKTTTPEGRSRDVFRNFCTPAFLLSRGRRRLLRQSRKGTFFYCGAAPCQSSCQSSQNWGAIWDFLYLPWKTLPCEVYWFKFWPVFIIKYKYLSIKSKLFCRHLAVLKGGQVSRVMNFYGNLKKFWRKCEKVTFLDFLYCG